MEQDAGHAAEVAAAQEAGQQPVAVVGHEVHVGAEGTAEQHAAAAAAAHAQHLQQHHDAAAAAAAAAAAQQQAMDVMAVHDQHQLGAVQLTDQAAVAAALAAAAMGSGLSMAGLLAAPLSAAHASALMGTPTMGGEVLGGDGGAMSAGAGRAGPASIPRGQEGYSRKAKSLSLLCENFVSQFGQVVNQVINLDNAAAQLNVERRRIYDIVNVLESIKVVSKLQKNQYQWHGTAKLVETLTELHDEAQREMEEAKTMTGEDLSSLGLDDRKEKSMSRLSQRFVQMFMLSKTRSLGLDEAARALLGGNEDQGQYKTKVRRLYDIANILSALKIIEKTHVGDKGKPGFRWLGPEGLQTMRPAVATHHHLAAPAAAFHPLPGSFQAALAGDLPPLNMAGVAVGAGGMPEAGGADAAAAAAGVQVSLPAPASLYVGGGEHVAAAAPAAGAGGGGGGYKRPRRKSLRAREAEADTDEEEAYEEEGEEGGYEEGGGKRRGGEEGAHKRLKVEQQPDQAAAAAAAAQQQQQQQQANAAAAAAQQHAPPGVAMFSELPLVMPGATTDAATAAAMAAAMASGAYAADALAAHAAGSVSNKPKVHPLLKFMELESQTEQGSAGMRRMMGGELAARTDAHEGQEGAQTAAWPAATAWGGMGMEWLTNPAMAAVYSGGFWPTPYAANMATTTAAQQQHQQQARKAVGDGQPASSGDAAAAAAVAAQQQAEGQAAAGGEAAAGGQEGLQQVAYNYAMPAAGAAPKAEGEEGSEAQAPPAEGQVVVGAADAAAAAAAAAQAQGGDIASGQPVMDAQQAAAQQAGNPMGAWQYWQYMYTNLYANAASAAQAVNPASVYTNMYANWTKKHEPGTADGAEGAAQGMEGAPAGDAAAAPAGLPMGAYPVGVAADLAQMGYAAAPGTAMGEAQPEDAQHDAGMVAPAPEQEGVGVPAPAVVQQ